MTDGPGCRRGHPDSLETRASCRGRLPPVTTRRRANVKFLPHSKRPTWATRPLKKMQAVLGGRSPNGSVGHVLLHLPLGRGRVSGRGSTLSFLAMQQAGSGFTMSHSLVKLHAQVVVSLDRKPTKEQIAVLPGYMAASSALSLDQSIPIPDWMQGTPPSLEISWGTLSPKDHADTSHLSCDVIITLTKMPTDQQIQSLAWYLSGASNFTRDYSRPVPSELRGSSISCSIAWSTLRKQEANKPVASKNAPCLHVEVRVGDEYINVTCPHCNHTGEFYREAVERGGNLLCGCGCQYTVRRPLPPKKPLTLTCPHCNRPLTVQRADVDAGSTFSCSCQGQFTVAVIEEAPISASGYKFRHGGFDEPVPSAPSMPFVPVPCWGCAQTGKLGDGPCPYCGGKGIRLAPNG